MSNWQKYFDSKILDRGLEYFESGAVSGLNKKGAIWRATVTGGSRSYEVAVPDSLDASSSSCTCPYFAGGKNCKHIAAVMFAVESGATDEPAPAKKTSLADAISQLSDAEKNAIIERLAAESELLRRQILATVTGTDAKQAKRDIQKTTTDLMKVYERSGYIEWRDSMDFENEYLGSIDAIVGPFFTHEDVAGLLELVIPRLVQLQRVRIDDSNGFFSEALYAIMRHIAFVLEKGSAAQRKKLFKLLQGFIEKNPGRDRGHIYWFEKEQVESFVIDNYCDVAEYAPQFIEMADKLIAELEPDITPYGRDMNEFARNRWRTVRMRAKRALGASADEMLAESDGLLGKVDGLYAVVGAYVEEGNTEKAIELLRAHLGAYSDRGVMRRKDEEEPVDKLIRLVSAKGDDAEMAELYTWLLTEADFGINRNLNVTAWYDGLKELTGEERWPETRKSVLAAMRPNRRNACLSHEGSFEELMASVEADDGVNELLTYERELAPLYPKPYIEYYTGRAEWEAKVAGDRRTYKRVADLLRKITQLGGGGPQKADELAQRFREANPRRTAFHDELRKAGF